MEGRWLTRGVAAVLFMAGALAARAGEVQVAVAANFTGPMQVIAPVFERDTGHQVRVSSGATGKFYAQITNGAPYEVLLAADDKTPARLIGEGWAVAGSAFTYALGKLVLWSANPARVAARGEVLRKGDFRHLALANPKVAPYGAAAMQVMNGMGVLESLRPRLVQGENIAQTHQFVVSGAAELGFVAYSQVIRNGQVGSGSGWVVPASYHDPIRQDAVLLGKGAQNPAATALLDFLRSEKARQIILSYGYDL